MLQTPAPHQARPPCGSPLLVSLVSLACLASSVPQARAASVIDQIGQFMLLVSPVSDLGVPDARPANPGNGFGVGTLILTGNHHSVSVTVVPEPRPVLLLLASAFPLVFLRREKRALFF